jgi:hypothetical protein
MVIKKRLSAKVTNLKRVKIENEEIEVRDLREKFYIIDDAYLNGYARKCGIYATGVYNVLCRHAGIDQSCFPSIGLMSDRLGISVSQVRRAIRILESWKIIKVERVSGERNRYWLLNNSEWRADRWKEFYKVGSLRKASKAEWEKVSIEDESTETV